jgi:hypothetical protein
MFKALNYECSEKPYAFLAWLAAVLVSRTVCGKVCHTIINIPYTFNVRTVYYQT